MWQVLHRRQKFAFSINEDIDVWQFMILHRSWYKMANNMETSKSHNKPKLITIDIPQLSNFSQGTWRKNISTFFRLKDYLAYLQKWSWMLCQQVRNFNYVLRSNVMYEISIALFLALQSIMTVRVESEIEDNLLPNCG